MALLKYLTLKRHNTTKTSSECLPDASGPLAITMPSGSITATNSSVAKVLEHPETRKQRGEYQIYSYMVHLVAFSSSYLHLMENLGRPNSKELLSRPEQGQLNIT